MRKCSVPLLLFQRKVDTGFPCCFAFLNLVKLVHTTFADKFCVLFVVNGFDDVIQDCLRTPHLDLPVSRVDSFIFGVGALLEANLETG